MKKKKQCVETTQAAFISRRSGLNCQVYIPFSLEQWYCNGSGGGGIGVDTLIWHFIGQASGSAAGITLKFMCYRCILFSCSSQQEDRSPSHWF